MHGGRWPPAFHVLSPKDGATQTWCRAARPLLSGLGERRCPWTPRRPGRTLTNLCSEALRASPSETATHRSYSLLSGNHRANSACPSFARHTPHPTFPSSGRAGQRPRPAKPLRALGPLALPPPLFRNDTSHSTGTDALSSLNDLREPQAALRGRSRAVGRWPCPSRGRT